MDDLSTGTTEQELLAKILFSVSVSESTDPRALERSRYAI